jgi:hypothetical protein
MSKAHICWGKITSLCCSELDYLFTFNRCLGNPFALLQQGNERDSSIGEKNILPSQKAKRKSGQSEKKTDQVVFLSGEMVPVSGIWRPDHTRCPSVGDVWLRKQTPFPPCPGCGLSAGFGLIEEVLHISEDPDFQEGPGTEP